MVEGSEVSTKQRKPPSSRTNRSVHQVGEELQGNGAGLPAGSRVVCMFVGRYQSNGTSKDGVKAGREAITGTGHEGITWLSCSTSSQPSRAKHTVGLF